MPVVRRSIHHLCVLSIKVSTNAWAFTHIHSQTHTCTHIHLPVWIISGFPQWVLEPVLFSPLFMTFPCEPPTTVGLITCSSNTYLSVQWQLMCAGFIWFSTNNSKPSVTLPPFHQPKREINLVMSTWLHPPPQQLAIFGFGCRQTLDQALLHSSRSPQLWQTDLIYVCLSNRLGNHRNCSAGKCFPTATSDQRHLESGCGMAGSIGIQDRLSAPWLALFAQRNLSRDVKRGNTTKEWGEGKGGERRRRREGWKD